MEGMNNDATTTDKSSVELDPKLILEGITKEDIEKAVHVLSVINKVSSSNTKNNKKNTEVYRHKSLRPLRKALADVFEIYKLFMYNGKSEEEFYEGRLKSRSLKRQKMAESSQQRVFLDNSLLRKTRIENLNKLMTDARHEEQARYVMLIPDGVAVTNVQIQSEEAPLALALTLDVAETETLLPKLRSCYVCKQRYRKLHFFYDQLCPDCATLNYVKRNVSTCMDGKIAVVTGARVKIGLQTCLKLLRAGATVVATTRFPNAAAAVYAQQTDFDTFEHRLHIVGLDLRDIPGIELFVHFLHSQFRTIHILINNACQTIRKPAHYYSPLIDQEINIYKANDSKHKQLLACCHQFEQLRSDPQSSPTNLLPSSSQSDNQLLAKPGPFSQTGLTHSARLSQTVLLHEDILDQSNTNNSPSLISKDINGQPLDLRPNNSWLLKLHQISTPELLETMMINAVAPFILNSRIINHMIQTTPSTITTSRYIINVSAMEGKFYRYKMPNHPHTNMAKAALNMLTRTSAEHLAKDYKIFMNSVDTGWINDENPLPKAVGIAERNHFQTPIDEIDAAARILDPVFTGEIEKLFPFGKFFKDYRETEW